MPLKATAFLNSQETDGLEYSHKYDVLYSYGNKKYANKEKKNGVNVIAFKLTNKTNEDINLNSLRLKTGNTEVIPMDNSIVAKQLRQCAPCYLFYSLLFLNIYKSDGYSVEVAHIPIGVPIAAFNLITAVVANQKLKMEFMRYDLKGKHLAPGETVMGLVGVRNLNYEPIKVELKSISIKE